MWRAQQQVVELTTPLATRPTQPGASSDARSFAGYPPLPPLQRPVQ
jgi:hypothetical protein